MNDNIDRMHKPPNVLLTYKWTKYVKDIEKNVTNNIGINTVRINVLKNFNWVRMFKIISLINKEDTSIIIWTTITIYALSVNIKAKYDKGKIISRIPPIHHVVDVRLPVASITVTRESESNTSIVKTIVRRENTTASGG